MLKKMHYISELKFFESTILKHNFENYLKNKLLRKKIGFMKKCAEHTCDYIDFYCHMGYLLSFVVSYLLFVFFNNANTVRVEM